jgi:YegS/Rv2252/BmrU family lipid kinase
MKTVVILNRKSRAGNNPGLELLLKKKFPAPEGKLEITAYPGHATEIARRAVENHAGQIVIVGGDGTFHEVVNGIIGSSVLLAIVPAGTANDLASYLSFPNDVARACDAIRQGVVRPTDIIQVNERYFITAGGIGFPSEVAALANAIKSKTRIGRLLSRLFSSLFYCVSALLAILVRTRHRVVRITSNGDDITSDVFSLTISNQPFLGKKFRVSPGAVNNDGQMDVCLIPNSKTGLGALAIVLKVILGRHVLSRSVKRWRAERLEVESRRALPFLADGELDLRATKFTVQVHPRAVNLIVPAGGA